jgi:hypothetical protein
MQLFGYFKGNVVSLARHPTGSAVLEAAYVLGNATQRSAMVAEFYGPEFSLKAHAAVVQGACTCPPLLVSERRQPTCTPSAFPVEATTLVVWMRTKC